MIDGIKILNLSVTAEALLQNNRLMFALPIDELTGAILDQPRRSTDRGMTFTVDRWAGRLHCELFPLGRKMLTLLMNSLRPTFEQRGLDLLHWQQMMNRHPQEYIRRKLRAIHAYAQGQSVNTLAQKFAIHPNTLRHYITTYCLGGFELLCQPERREQPKRLTPQQEADFKQILLKKRPNECGLTGNIWTGQLMCQYLTATYQVDYHSGIYDLLERLNLSHQKAHADYGNADSAKQQTFLNEFKNSLLSSDNTHAVVVYDEFSVAEKPTSY